MSATIDGHGDGDDAAMAIALEEAKLAASHGDVPVGCVLIAGDGSLLGRGHNRREADQDPTAHAELVALRAGAQARGRWYLDDVTAYVTLEPCVMCAGALVLARVKRVVFGCRDPKGGALVSAFTLGSSPLLNHQFLIDEALREGECRELLQSFFRDVRARRARERLSSK